MFKFVLTISLKDLVYFPFTASFAWICVKFRYVGKTQVTFSLIN